MPGYQDSREPATVDQPVIQLRNFTKTFGATRALKHVNVEFHGGDIHAVCGQNGSGKSTLIKILAAYHSADPGAELMIGGEEVKLPLRPGQPERLGLRFVHQDLGLAMSLSVLDNLYVAGYPMTKLGVVNWRLARRRAAATLARFGLDVPLTRPVSALRPAERAILAIARAMQNDSGGTQSVRLLVLDEPTAHLPGPDIGILMRALRSACDDGVAVVIVTHRIEEVLEYSDRATVLRDGAVVATRRVAELDHQSLVELLLGRQLGEQYPPSAHASGRELLKVRNFSTGQAKDVELVVHTGEIVGVTGLTGSGFEDLPYGLFAAQPYAGEVSIDGKAVRFRTPSDAIAGGFSLVPADRINMAGVTGASLVENLTLPTLNRYRSGPFLNRRRENRYAAKVLDRYDVRPAGPVNRDISTLSGGNQQKLLMARWLESNPRVMLLHEPTQGVDIGSRRQLFDLIVDAATKGCAIVLASSQYADLAAVCDRVLIFYRGSVIAELSGAEMDEDIIAARCLAGAST